MHEISWNEAITLASPHPYALGTTIDQLGKPNAIGLGWWTIVSWTPPMLAISVGPKRYSHECLEHCGEFGLCLPSKKLARAAWICGTKTGRKVDKFELGPMTAVAAQKIRPPLIAGSTVAFECRVHHRLTTGDHTLFVGDVLAIHGDVDAPEHLYSIHYKRLVSLSHEGSTDFEVEHD
jgi:flavin reductase (DIM6/NTAB) family NADH-FMN oxidoreductase RutF